MRGLLAMAAAVALLGGCTAVPTEVGYDRYRGYASERAGNRSYTELGPVQASERGPLWGSCAEIAEAALARLDARRQALGGDALVGVRWRDHRGTESSRVPNCTREWGWGVFLGIGLALPWTQVAQVEALVVRFDDPPRSDTDAPARPGSYERGGDPR